MKTLVVLLSIIGCATIAAGQSLQYVEIDRIALTYRKIKRDNKEYAEYLGSISIQTEKNKSFYTWITTRIKTTEKASIGPFEEKHGQEVLYA